MSDHDPTAGKAGDDPADAWPDEEARTVEQPAITSVLTPPPESTSDLADEDADGDEWAPQGPARGIRLGLPVAALLAVLLIAAGFWGGAALEKSHRPTSSVGSGFAGRARGAGGLFSAAGGGFGSGGAAGASSAGTTGTISVVNGNTLYVLSSAGALVKVTLTGSTTITRTADTTALGLRPGDTVTIVGTTAANGDVAATSVTSTAPGVSSTASGFGIGGGAGTAGTGAGSPSSGATTTAGG